MTKPAASAAFRAAALSPLAVIPASVPVAMWLGIHDSSQSNEPAWLAVWTHLKAMVVVNAFAVPAAYALMLVIGLPAALVFLTSGRTPVPAALVSGAAAGAGLFFLLKPGLDGVAPLAMIVWTGLVVAGVFWFLFRRFSRRAGHDLVVAA